MGRCDRTSVYFIKNQCAEVYSLFPTWQRDGKQGRTRDKSIMTCPMSPSKRVLLPQREVAVTVWYQRARDDAKIVYFLVRAREGGSAKYTMPTRS
jgi:hypothetical protein